jgi:hypothetical protein
MSQRAMCGYCHGRATTVLTVVSAGARDGAYPPAYHCNDVACSVRALGIMRGRVPTAPGSTVDALILPLAWTGRTQDPRDRAVPTRPQAPTAGRAAGGRLFRQRGNQRPRQGTAR